MLGGELRESCRDRAAYIRRGVEIRDAQELRAIGLHLYELALRNGLPDDDGAFELVACTKRGERRPRIARGRRETRACARAQDPRHFGCAETVFVRTGRIAVLKFEKQSR